MILFYVYYRNYNSKFYIVYIYFDIGFIEVECIMVYKIKIWCDINLFLFMYRYGRYNDFIYEGG